MTISLIQAFEQIIEPTYALNKTGNMFQIEETARDSTNRQLKIGGSKGFGFSLDQPGRHPWQFIIDGPLKGVVSVCDGVLILRYKNKNYIIVLDLKSTKVSEKAMKQLYSGIYLCKWLCNLLKLNNHLTESFEFIGVVCKTRGSVAKKTSRKGLNAVVDRSKSIPLITLSNPGTIHIKDLVALL